MPILWIFLLSSASLRFTIARRPKHDSQPFIIRFRLRHGSDWKHSSGGAFPDDA